MTAKQDTLITALLQKIETSFQHQNGATRLTVCMRRRLTSGDTTLCWIRKMAENNRKWW